MPTPVQNAMSSSLVDQYLQRIRPRLDKVQERIRSAAERAGRSAKEVTLVAVSKGHPAEAVIAAYRLGVRDFGENRVEEAGPKMGRVSELLTFPPDDAPRWHLIGHLQSRKAAQAIGPYVLIHSVDRLKIARRLERFAAEVGRVQPILLEINVSGEASKFGFRPEEVEQAVNEIVVMPHLRIQGLMTMAPLVEDPEETRPVFARLRALRDRLVTLYPTVDWCHLSMGMSNDFEIAIEEGATLVRIGTAIFGPREE